MTMLSNIRPFPPAAIRNRNGLRGLLVGRSRWLVDRVVAAVIARHQRQVELFVLRRLTDQELRDIGICRNQIGPSLQDAATTRAQLQMKRNWPAAVGNLPSCANDVRGDLIDR